MAKTSSEPDKALALPVELRAGAVIEGMDKGTDLVGRLALYNGTTDEQEMYAGCGFAPGDFIDVLERRKVASDNIVPLGAYVSWMKWPQGARTPEYNVREKARVPAGDLEWVNEKPPAATECINTLVAVDGEPWPYLLVFKRTGYKAGETMFRLEARRGMIGKGRGLYRITTKKEKNAAGQSYLELNVQPAGDCPDSLVGIVTEYIKHKASIDARAAALADEGAGDKPDSNDIPI